MRKDGGKSIRFRNYQWAVLKEVAQRHRRSLASVLDDFIWQGLANLDEPDLVEQLETGYYEWLR